MGRGPSRALGSFGIPGEGTDLGTLRNCASKSVFPPQPGGGVAGFGTLG